MGKLIFKYSVMNAGKSTNLLQQNHNFSSTGQNVLLLKSSIDTRSNTIKSGLCVESACTVVEPHTNILTLFTSLPVMPDVILADESQFLTTEQVLQLRLIVNDFKINVFCYGLRTDFKGKLFEGSKALFECADTFEELKTICSCTKHKAIMVAKFDKNGHIVRDGEIIDCGAEDKYISLCHDCWIKGKIPSINDEFKRKF
jgi:thymidine kinase